MTASMSEAEIEAVASSVNPDDYSPRKQLDSTVASRILQQAHVANPVFRKIVSDWLSQFGHVKDGPVKRMVRMIAKAEEYAKEAAQGKD